MSYLDAEKLKIGSNLSYDELIELIYNLDGKFNEMKINDSFFDVEEVKLILDAVAKIAYDISLNVSNEDMTLNKELFSNRENHISKYSPLLIKAINEKDDVYGMEILDSFIDLNNAYKSDMRTFKEDLQFNLIGSNNKNMDENVLCENCGSKNLAAIDGIVTCQSCGAKYPNMSLKKMGLDEELKEKEIRRKELEIDGLLNPIFPNANSRIFGDHIPSGGITGNGNEFWTKS